jgi:hypothetical protein
MVIGHREPAEPRRFHTRVLGPDLGDNILDSVDARGQGWVRPPLRVTAHGDEIEDTPVPRIPDEYLDCVLYLYPSEADADAGTRTGGSGFWVGVPISSKAWAIYAVTNKHIIQNGNSVVRLSTQDGRKAFFPTVERDWVFHSDGDDLAIYSPSLEHNLANCRLNFVRRERVVDYGRFRVMDVGPGDDVFAVGRFINHEGRQRNLPTARFGCIGQMPWEPIQQDTGFMQESFLVEARSIGGYSGSPVFLHSANFRFGARQIISGPTRGPWLLGVNWGHINDWGPVCDASGRPVNPGRPRDMQVRTNTGMMAVVPAWKLAELLDGEELARERAATAKKLREEEAENPPPATQD